MSTAFLRHTNKQTNQDTMSIASLRHTNKQTNQDTMSIASLRHTNKERHHVYHLPETHEQRNKQTNQDTMSTAFLRHLHSMNPMLNIHPEYLLETWELQNVSHEERLFNYEKISRIVWVAWTGHKLWDCAVYREASRLLSHEIWKEMCPCALREYVSRQWCQSYLFTNWCTRELP